MTYAVVPATEEHVIHVAANMREADVQEVYAAHHHTPFEALRLSVECTAEPMAGTVDGVPMCIFGIGQSTFLSRDGSPWLLGHRELPEHARAFLRMSRNWMLEERMKYTKLANYVDARNEHSIRWIKWLGYHVKPAKPFGAERMPFHRFEWVRPGYDEEENECVNQSQLPRVSLL